MRGIVCGMVAAICCSASSALADPPTALVFSYHYVETGGLLLAYPTPDGAWGRMSWEACPPEQACSAAAPDSASDRALHVGSVAPGTVFRATASDGEWSLTATSDPYLGPLRAVEPPTVVGQTRVGRVVQAVPGTWSGGWSGEKPILQLQACPSKRDSRCQVLATTFYWERCGRVLARISKRYEGWYLRVADSRTSREPVFGARGYSRARDISPVRRSAVTSVQTLGRIRPGRPTGRLC